MRIASLYVLVANAPTDLRNDSWFEFRTRNGPGIVGIDGGALALERAGVVPDYVTGDFDSLTPNDLTRLEKAGATIVPTPDQDYTDLDKAISFVRSLAPIGCSLDVFGAVGGRIDHTYSAFSAMIKHGRDEEIVFYDEIATYRLAPLAPKTLSLRDFNFVGRTISLMAFGPVDGVVTTGVRWPLNGESLAPGVRDGTLNVVTEPRVTISVERGDLIVMLHHARR